MADTSVQREVEGWVRNTWLPDHFRQAFESGSKKLQSGGSFDFDAVSSDGETIASISTSSYKTASGRYGSGKMMKLRADMLFLLMTDAKHRLIVLTEKDMFEACQNEATRGRVPSEIEFIHAEIPVELRQKLTHAKQKASKEVSPQ